MKHENMLTITARLGKLEEIQSAEDVDEATMAGPTWPATNRR